MINYLYRILRLNSVYKGEPEATSEINVGQCVSAVTVRVGVVKAPRIHGCSGCSKQFDAAR
jgi:hypothetical protein